MPPTEDTGSVRTKEALLQAMATEHDRLLDAIKEISPAYMEAPEVVPGWPLKDLLGHIFSWQLIGIQRVSTVLAGGQYKKAASPEILNAMNNEDISKRRHLSVTEMEAFSKQAHQDLQQLLERLTPEQLARPEIYDVFESVGVRHYRQHLADILAFRRRILGVTET